MKPKLVLHPTETSQWHALLNDAQAECNCLLSEDLESYLVFLLMRFTQTPELANSVLAMDFLNQANSDGVRRLELLQALGDKSLLFSGLFPGLASKRLVSIDYFIDMGKTAYFTIADIDTAKGSELFSDLGENFVSLKTVLSNTKVM